MSDAPPVPVANIAPPLTGALDVFDLCRELRAACAGAGGQRAWSEAQGIGESVVADTLAGRREPGPQILRAMGYRKVTRYAKTRSASAGAPGA